MSLGIFKRIWTLLEEACIDLDFKLALHGHDSSSDPVCDNYTINQISALRVELQIQQSYADILKEMITVYTHMLLKSVRAWRQIWPKLSRISLRRYLIYIT